MNPGCEVMLSPLPWPGFQPRASPALQTPVSNCSCHIFTAMSNRHLKLHTSKHPKPPCSSHLFRFTLHPSCSNQKPQSQPRFLSFSRHTKYNQARSIQDLTPSHHVHRHGPSPSHHNQSLGYCNGLLRGLPASTLCPVPSPSILNTAAV